MEEANKQVDKEMAVVETYGGGGDNGDGVPKLIGEEGAGDGGEVTKPGGRRVVQVLSPRSPTATIARLSWKKKI